MTTYNPVSDILKDYIPFAELKAAEEQAWQARDVIVDRRAEEADPQERRLLAIVIDAMADAANEIGGMATEAYRKAWTK